MNTFQLTIQRQSKAGNQWPIVAEHTRPGVLLPIRSEGILEFEQSDFDELYSRLGYPKDYGTYLGNAVFQNEIGKAFIKAMSESQKPLHVLLFVEADELELRTLRWERLCAPIDGGWYLLRLDQRVPFSLYLPSQTDRRFPPIGKRDLRALVIVANPSDSERFGLAPFDVASTVRGIREALGDIPCDVLAPIEEAIGPPSLDELCQQLTDRHKHYSLLHFVCHGRLLDDKETVLYLTNNENQMEPVPAQRFLERLRSLQGPRGLPHFAFFSTCESASPEAEGALGGLGQRLVRDLGMPAVVAMTEKITIKTALRLGRRFYRQLRLSGQVDLALDEATSGLSEREDVTFPALYSRLGWQPLFSDNLERDLTHLEIKEGLERLQTLVTERAPILQNEFEQHTQTLQGTLEADITALSLTLRQEREQALYELNILCQEICEISFNALALAHEPPDSDPRCPFLGLYPFRLNDRAFFFGRENLIKALCQKLDEHHFLAVLGPSGSGKSSVIFAGVVPQLQEQYSDFEMIDFTPTHDPMGQLTTAKAQVQSYPTLFIVDQFEELFTLCPEEEQRQQFIDELLTLSQLQPVVITLRADFWGECAPYEALKNLMEQQQTLIGPMNTAELRAAMEQQAAKVGLRFEADLSNAILDDVSGEPGAMPLLQHALQELWKRRHGRWLKSSEYREGIGGVKQAIAKTADAVYYSLSQADKAQFKNIFIRLTRLDDQAIQEEGRRDTRQRVALEELVPAGGELSATKKWVNHLADARLVVTSMNAVTHQEEVEVAHEALIRYWPRLANWLDENRTNLQLRETIRQSALTWEENQTKEDYLVHKGVRLEEASLLARQTCFLNQLEANYVNACLTLAEAAEKAINRRRKMTIASLITGLIIALILAGFAFLQRNEAVKAKDEAIEAKNEAKNQKIIAEKQRDEAKKQTDKALRTQSLFLSDLSRQQTEKGNVNNGLLLALEALPKDISEPKRPYVPEATKALHKAMLNPIEQMVIRSEGEIKQVSFSPDGSQLITVADSVSLWDIQTRQRLNQLKFPPCATLDPEGNLMTQIIKAPGEKLGCLDAPKLEEKCIIYPPEEGELYFDDSETESGYSDLPEEQSSSLSEKESGENNFPKELDYFEVQNQEVVSIPGCPFIIKIKGKNANLLDEKGERLFELKNPFINTKMNLMELNFSPNKRVIAGFVDTSRSTSQYGQDLIADIPWQDVILWDTQTGEHRVMNGAENIGTIIGVSFSSNNDFIAVHSMKNQNKSHTITLWKIQDTQVLKVLLDQQNGIFSPDGKFIATSDSFNLVHLWDVESGKAIKEIQLPQNDSDEVKSLAFSPDGKLSFTSAFSHYDEEKKTVRLWKEQNGKLIKQFEWSTNNLPLSLSTALSPDGKLMLVKTLEEQKQTTFLWKEQSGQFIKKLELSTNHDSNTALSPNGNWIVYSDYNKKNKTTLALWKAQSDQFIKTFEWGTNEEVLSTVFNPDGKLIATASATGITLWQIPSGKRLDRLETTGELSFSPDGKWLAAASYDGLVLWRLDNRKQPHILLEQIGEVIKVAFSPDSKWLLTELRVGDFNNLTNTINTYLWRVFSPQELIDNANRKVIRCLTPAQRQQFFLCDSKNSCESESDKLIKAGKRLAKEGEIKAAITQFNKAKTLATCLKFDSETKAKALARAHLLKEGKPFAQEIPQPAIANVKALKKLNTPLKVEPKGTAKQLTDQHVVVQKQALLELDSESKVKPLTASSLVNPEKALLDIESQAKQLKASSLISQGKALARQGKIELAIAKFKQAQQLDPNKEVQGWVEVLQKGENSFIVQSFSKAETQKVHTDCALVTTESTVLNIRAKPSEQAAKIGTASKNSALRILETVNARWYKVRLNNGQLGYVMRDYVSEDGSQCGIIVTRTIPLNIRANTSIKSQRISKASKDSALPILEIVGSWARIKLNNGKTGYAHLDYIKIP